MGKKWLVIIIIIAVILVLVAVPAGFVLAINNSTYDCSFQYAKADNLLNEIAKKHMYYNASDKTVEFELSQDMINSLIKDNFASLKLDLPKNVAIKEILFNTKDQRLYINAKYGSINTPVSAKLNVKILEDGLAISAGDIKIGRMNAPGFVKSQLPADAMKYSLKFADLGLPQLFTVKDIKFGSGTLTAVIQLDPKKVADYALTYRADLMKEVDKFKTGQPGALGIFLNKLLGTGVLSEEKFKEYVEQALGNEELMNSVRFFATATDLTKYSNSLDTAEKKVMDFVAPLQSIGGFTTIDEAVETILNNDKLKEFLTWFVTPEQIDQYSKTISDYYGMYRNYMGMYDDLTASIDKTAAGIKIKDINDYAKLILDNSAQAEDARKYVYDKVLHADKDAINKFVPTWEKDKALQKEYIIILNAFRKDSQDFLSKTYKKEIAEFEDVVKDRQAFSTDFVSKLQKKQYERALTKVQGNGIVGKKTQTFIDKYSKEIDFNLLDELK